MKPFSQYFALSLGVLAVSSLAASADVQVRLSDGVNTVVVADQGPDDLDPLVGVVNYQGPIGPMWVVTVTTAVSKPVIGSAGAPQMDLRCLDISAGAGTISIELTDTDFTGNGDFLASIGGTTEGSVSFATWTDAGNAPFGKTTPMTSQGPFLPISYGENAMTTVSTPAPYSITLQVDVTHIGPALSGFDAFIAVTPEPPEEGHTGCRTTGGGRQADSFPKVAYVTHGGQVGAPVGNETEFSPDTPCIRGNWEHVRHEKGGNKGNFHAKSYDSLLCACLGCPEDPNAPVTIGDICNPGMRTCGPEPRQAPANKITFSGVGDYTTDKGKREFRSVLFRVDLEDRGEPGNSHAKGSKAPHDRHRIRIWILTDAELAQLNNPADRLLSFREAISAGHGLLLKDGAIQPGGQPVPNGTAVFGVRAPDIDDGGEMTHGNHQIHPTIKLCP
jgi:hypothetical protein